MIYYDHIKFYVWCISCGFRGDNQFSQEAVQNGPRCHVSWLLKRYCTVTVCTFLWLGHVLEP